jgi:hypothetical protein
MVAIEKLCPNIMGPFFILEFTANPSPVTKKEGFPYVQILKGNVH